MIKLKQNVWLKPHIDMNTDLRKKYIFKLMNNIVFERTMENIEALNLSEEETTKFFTENLLTIEMKKTKRLMNKPAYLRLPVLELSKILMYDF